MKEITKDNYKDLEYNFEGIVVAYPKVDLYFNAEFYFIKQKIDYKTDKRYYITCGYNEEDKTCNGLAPDGLETIIENAFNCWSQMNYYQFDDMKEFCDWYLHKDDKLHQALEQFVEDTKKFYEKDWIHEKGNTNTPPSTVPKQPSKGNKLMCQDEVRDKINPEWNTRRQQLQDVLKLLELRDRRQSTLDTLLNAKEPSLVEHLQNQLDRDDKRIEDFLNEKIL